MSTATQVQLVWPEHDNLNQFVSSFSFTTDLNLDGADIYCGKFEPAGAVTLNGQPIEIIYFTDFLYENKKFSFTFPGVTTLTKLIVSDAGNADPIKFTIIPPGKQHSFIVLYRIL